VIAASPLGEGLLTSTVGLTKADESSHHTADQLASRKVLAAAAAKWVRPDRTLAQTALRFVLALEDVAVAIPSAVTRAQLDENLATLETPPLTETEFAEMRALTQNVQLNAPPKSSEEFPAVGSSTAQAAGAQIQATGSLTLR